MSDPTATDGGETGPPRLSTIRAETYKERDAWWTVLVIDPVASRILWLLLRVMPHLRPMSVTAASLLLGVASAVLFATGHLILGAIAFQLSFLADCIDGKLARMTGRSSLLGAFADGFVNHAVYAMALMGLAVHLTETGNRAAAILVIGLLVLRVVTVHANRFVPKAGRGWARAFADDDSSALARRRLLPPLSFPDKQAILFVGGPAFGLLLPAAALNLLLEVALLVGKLVKIRHALADREHVEGWDDGLGVGE